MKRLPAREKLGSMHWQNAWGILDSEAKQCREIPESDGVSYCDLTLQQGRARAAHRLDRIYDLANELGHCVGQPDRTKDAREFIAYHAGAKAAWRQQKAEKYFCDTRNLKAVELLEALIVSEPQDNNLATKFWRRYGSDSLRYRDYISDYLTGVGFRSHPKNADEFMRIALGEAASQKEAV